VPKAVFNLLGANFTDRYELANIIAFKARRLRAEDTHVVARTTVVSHVLERLTGCMTRREAQRTPVQWTKAAVLPFLKIKHKLIHFAYNYIIDPEAPLVIYADSSLTAIGAALTQEIKGVLLPGGFMSKSLNPTQTRYPIFDKELYSCFMAVKYFSAEISGRQVTMYNDHYALV